MRLCMRNNEKYICMFLASDRVLEVKRKAMIRN